MPKRELIVKLTFSSASILFSLSSSLGSGRLGLVTGAPPKVPPPRPSLVPPPLLLEVSEYLREEVKPPLMDWDLVRIPETDDLSQLR